MSRERCIELLESSNVGRVAWQSSDGQQILPVSYAYHQGTVIFRTSPFGVLSELVHAHDAAFGPERSGPQDLVQFWTVGRVSPWAAGIRILFVRLTPRRITGRQLLHDPP